jgi:hypothetical protein
MFTRTLFCTENTLHYFQTYENTVGAKNDKKLKFDFCNWVLHFIASHNWETTRFRRQLTNKCSQELYFVLKTALPLFPDLWETLLGAKKMTKQIRLFANSWVLHFIAATIDKTTRLRQLTNKCSQELYFVLKTALPLFPQTYENTVGR